MSSLDFLSPTPTAIARSPMEREAIAAGARIEQRDGWNVAVEFPDEQGRLWSEVLGLYLVVRGRLLQAQTAEGRLLLTPEETGAALQAAEEARRNAEEARRREEEARRNAEEARRRAEEEAERLRRELERYRSQGTD